MPLIYGIRWPNGLITETFTDWEKAIKAFDDALVTLHDLGVGDGFFPTLQACPANWAPYEEVEARYLPEEP